MKYKKRQLVFVLLFLIISCATPFKLPKWWNEKGETTGVVLWTPEGSSYGTTGYGFYVDSVRYIGVEHRYSLRTTIKGDKYIVAYNKSNPDKNLLLDYKIVFEENDETEIVVGEIVQTTKLFLRSTTRPLDIKENIIYIDFTYAINGVKYERSNCFYITDGKYPEGIEPPEKNRTYDKKLNKETKYKVKYWVDNPQRSVILLDEPIKNE